MLEREILTTSLPPNLVDIASLVQIHDEPYKQQLYFLSTSWQFPTKQFTSNIKSCTEAAVTAMHQAAVVEKAPSLHAVLFSVGVVVDQ